MNIAIISSKITWELTRKVENRRISEAFIYVKNRIDKSIYVYLITILRSSLFRYFLRQKMASLLQQTLPRNTKNTLQKRLLTVFYINYRQTSKEFETAARKSVDLHSK